MKAQMQSMCSSFLGPCSEDMKDAAAQFMHGWVGLSLHHAGIDEPSRTQAVVANTCCRRPFSTTVVGCRNARQPRMTAKELFLAFYQICSGLACLHSRCIVHQDLHLANALFSQHGQVCKLADVGNAAHNRSGDKANVLEEKHCW